jgi:hypothetical protein
MVKEGSENGKAAKAWTDWRPAIVPALALIAVGVVPGLLKGLYEPYTGNLMAAYVSFGMLFMVAVVGGMAFMALRDLSSRRQKVFRLAPDGQPVRGTDVVVPIEADHSEKQ